MSRAARPPYGIAGLVLARLVAAVPTLLVVSLLVFVVSTVLPGDVGRAILGPYASGEQVARLNAELGYDQPLPLRYASFVTDFVTGDWGSSPVRGDALLPLILARLGSSLRLALLGLVLAVPPALALGLLAALREGTATDRTISVAGLSLVAVPEFVSGVFLIVVFAVRLRWFPVSASGGTGLGVWSQARALLLPAATVALVLFGYLSRTMRAGAIQALRSDYVRSAVLKGLPRRLVLRRHVLRNALLPLIGVLATQLGYLVGGLVVIEALFSYSGLGSLLLDAATTNDVPLLALGTMVIAVLYLSLSLAADIAYGLVDPRVTHARRRG